MRIYKVLLKGALVGILLSLWQSPAYCGRIADIAKTKHNFSASPAFPVTLQTNQSRDVRATQEPQICVFCHTPHAADTNIGPLWNRQITNPPYTTYTSGSLDSGRPGLNPQAASQPLQPPNGVSKLCLSCHDGTMAIGAVNVLNGRSTDKIGTTEDIAMRGTGQNGVMPLGEGATTGFTRNLGIDLTNDHPISMRYDASLAAVDGELNYPNLEPDIIVRGVDPWPASNAQRTRTEYIHLEPDPGTSTGGLVQCNSCHDPHVRSTDPTENIKFLRLNRFQKLDPQANNFRPADDIICLACHDKAGWVGSAHANANVAREMYTTAAAQVREFPQNTEVWKTACLACHDTHTVQGSRRLLREGVDGGVQPSASGYTIKSGLNAGPAIEETCFACHSGTPNYTLVNQGTGNFEVPDIKTDFEMATHMPIASIDQPAGQEVHNIGTYNSTAGDPNGQGKDLIESQTLLGLGVGNLVNRHAECTDCHNPHRVIKNRRFNDDPTAGGPAGTHDHNEQPHHTNIASGVLRGTWGVEPRYGRPEFMRIPTGFDVKRGNPGISDAVGSSYVTREYQVCLKCHSNYAFSDLDNNFGNSPQRPQLDSFGGGTPSGTNRLATYTNVAMEYQAPNGHTGEGTSLTATGAGPPPSPNPNGADYERNNHRAWHPVMRETGRNSQQRGGANAANWRTPFQNIGVQTMYCTDCHGSDTITADGVVPQPKPGGTSAENGFPWGPHGSINNFILKGQWSGNTTGFNDGTGNIGTGDVDSQNHLCFKCHEYNQYGNAGLAGGMGMPGMGGGGGAPAPGAVTIQQSGFKLSDTRIADNCMMAGCMGGGGGGGGGNATLNLHVYHTALVSNWRCNLCHVAIPHGWKNKNFLVNLNDVGIEAGLTPNQQVRTCPSCTGGGMGGMGGGMGGGNGAVADPYSQGPYYNRAALKIINFAVSGDWIPNDCGSAGSPGNGDRGVTWMFQTGEACNNLP